MDRDQSDPRQSADRVDLRGGLRHIVRQDPDVIMVGEIRDRETADVAIRSALTGTSSIRRCTPTTRRARLRG